jgi:hypothetical protein
MDTFPANGIRVMLNNEAFVFVFPNGPRDEDQLPGLSKIETIDYRWLLHRGDRCTPRDLLRKAELERKQRAAAS